MHLKHLSSREFYLSINQRQTVASNITLENTLLLKIVLKKHDRSCAVCRQRCLNHEIRI